MARNLFFFLRRVLACMYFCPPTATFAQARLTGFFKTTFCCWSTIIQKTANTFRGDERAIWKFRWVLFTIEFPTWLKKLKFSWDTGRCRHIQLTSFIFLSCFCASYGGGCSHAKCMSWGWDCRDATCCM